jgi:hypothetical protein
MIELTTVAISKELHAKLTEGLERDPSGKIRYGETRRRIERLLIAAYALEKGPPSQ